MCRSSSRVDHLVGLALCCAWILVTYIVAKSIGLLDFAEEPGPKGALGVIGFFALLLLVGLLGLCAIVWLDRARDHLFLGADEVRRRDEDAKAKSQAAAIAEQQYRELVRAKHIAVSEEPRAAASYAILSQFDIAVFLLDDAARDVAQRLCGAGLAQMRGQHCARIIEAPWEAERRAIGVGFVERLNGLLLEVHSVGALRPTDLPIAFSAAAAGFSADETAAAVLHWRNGRTRRARDVISDLLATSKPRPT